MAQAEAPGDLERKASQADNNIKDILKQLTDIGGQLTTLTKLSNEQTRRLDGIDTKLTQHDARFDGIDTKLVQHDIRFDGLEGRLDGVERSQSSMIVKLEAFDETLREQSRNIRFMEGNTHEAGKTLTEHTVALGRLTATVDAHTGILTEHTQVLSSLVGTVQKHGARFDRVDSRFDGVDRVLAVISDKLDGALRA